jgi:hypothetical protein
MGSHYLNGAAPATGAPEPDLDPDEPTATFEGHVFGFDHHKIGFAMAEKLMRPASTTPETTVEETTDE